MGRKNTDSEPKIDSAIEAAEQAFWGEIVKAYPEVKTGDVPLSDAEFKFDMKRAVLEWLRLNKPTANATASCDLVVEMRPPRKGERGTVSVLLYKHRHGEDISVYATSEAAKHAALAIIADNLHELPVNARARIRAMLDDEGNGCTDDDVIEAWHEAQAASSDCERLEISEDVTVESADAKPEVTPRCPQCGESDVTNMEITETFTAYHPILRMSGGGAIVENALGTGCPSEHFDDGQSNYGAHCRSCLHDGTLAEFNLDISDWE